MSHLSPDRFIAVLGAQGVGLSQRQGQDQHWLGSLGFIAERSQAANLALDTLHSLLAEQRCKGAELQLLLSAQYCRFCLVPWSAAISRPREGATAAQPLKGLRIGLPAEFFGAGCAPDVLAAVRAALAEYEKLGATLVDISLPRTELSIPVYYIIAPAEASSNLSRFDGVKFGHRAAKYGDLIDMYKKSRSEAFGPEVQRRIMIGTYVLSHGYYDAYYLKAQQIRHLIAQDFQSAFERCDLIAGPVAPTVAWKIGEKSDDPMANYLADIYTLSTSLAGLPGMSVPAGFGAGGMPVGLQLVGNYFKEGELLHAAHAFQQATDWHSRSPSGF